MDCQTVTSWTPRPEGGGPFWEVLQLQVGGFVNDDEQWRVERLAGPDVVSEELVHKVRRGGLELTSPSRHLASSCCNQRPATASSDHQNRSLLPDTAPGRRMPSAERLPSLG